METHNGGSLSRKGIIDQFGSNGTIHHFQELFGLWPNSEHNYQLMFNWSCAKKIPCWLVPRTSMAGISCCSTEEKLSHRLIVRLNMQIRWSAHTCLDSVLRRHVLKHKIDLRWVESVLFCQAETSSRGATNFTFRTVSTSSIWTPKKICWSVQYRWHLTPPRNIQHSTRL